MNCMNTMEIKLSNDEQSHLTVLRYLARTFLPRSYLEIGVREGDSLIAVLDNSHIERLALADNWTTTYGGTGRGNGQHIQEILHLRGYAGAVRFLDGDSKDTLPIHQGELPAPYDLITVDGDHSASGARIDLENVLPLLSVGGFIVFDDIAHPGHLDLADVARDFLTTHADELEVAFQDTTVYAGVVIWRKFN